MQDLSAFAFSESTKALIKPINLASTDRVWIRLEDDSHYLIRIYGAEGHRPSFIATGSWVQRMPECKPANSTEDGIFYLIGATDFNVSILFCLWGDKLRFANEETQLHFNSLVAFIINGYEQAKLFQRYKAGEDIDLNDFGVIDHPEFPLKRHQKFATVNSLATDGYGLFKEQGTGKTPVGVATCCNHIARLASKQMGRVIIVCPNNVRLNWQIEMEKFATSPHQVTVLRGTKQVRVEKLLKSFINKGKNEFTVVIVGYDTLKTSLDYILKVDWDLGIADEIHYAKTPGNGRAKAMLKLRDKCHKRIGLTGTPITNTALDLYMLFEWMGKNYSGFTTFKAFKSFYGVYVTGESGFDKLVGLQNQAFMQERMARLSFIVRKEEALPDLPSKVYDVEEVAMTKRQSEIYTAVATQLQLEIENDMQKDDNKQLLVNNILTKLLRLAQITSGFVVYPQIVDEDGEIEQERSVESFAPNPKLDKLVELIKAKKPNSKSIVWACWQHDINTIKARLDAEGIKTVTFFGQTSFANRQKAMDDFNLDPETKVFLGNPAAAGTGVTLLGHDPKCPEKYETNCDQEFYYSQNWSMVTRTQSEDRPHRIGTRCTIQVTDLCVPETIDEEIRARVLDKITTALDIGDLRKVLSKVL